MQNWDREAAEGEAVVVNPFRHSIPAEFRNGDKLVSTQLCYAYCTEFQPLAWLHLTQQGLPPVLNEQERNLVSHRC